MRELKELPTYLEVRARDRDVITYNELAKAFAQNPVTPENYRSHPFCEIFGMMDGEDIRIGRPLRTALVYSAVLNRPGHGFFPMLSKARQRSILISEEEREWLTELQLLQAFYSR